MLDWLIILLLLLGVLVTYLYLVWQVLKSKRQRDRSYDLYEQHRHAEAADAFQARLAQRLPAGQEAHVRRLLAETLEALGKPEEAAMERERCRAAAMGAFKDPLALIAQGDLLAQEMKAEEACVFYEKALGLVAVGTRALIYAKLAAAQHNAGRAEEAVATAEAALRGRLAPSTQINMHRIAGLSLASQGLLEASEIHLRRSLALAESGKKPEQVSDCLATLAGIQYRQGQFTEAIMTCQQAETIYSSPARRNLSIQAACLRDMGRFEEARVLMRRYQQGSTYPQPRLERRMQAHGSLSMAWIEADAARPEAALEHVEEAREGLKAVSTSSVWPPPPLAGEHYVVVLCDATEAYIQAQLGQAEQARRLAVNVESRLTQAGQDRDTQLAVYGFLGSAALELSDLSESRRLWSLYLECGSDPVGLPSAYLDLGEIALRLGETEEARWAFQQAVAPGIDSLDARRAQARLDEMGMPG